VIQPVDGWGRSAPPGSGSPLGRIPTAFQARLPELKEVIQGSIGNPAHFNGAETSSAVFHNSYDWQSSVHAHWALLSMARLTGDLALEQFVLERLTPEVLANERAHLAANDSPKGIYGQVWLLMLLSELERHPAAASEELSLFRAETQARVLDWLKETPLPENGASFSASYDSWLFAFLLVSLSGPVGEDVRMELDLLYQNRLEPQREAIQKQGEGDFLYLPAILALIDRLWGDPTPYPPQHLAPLPDEVEVDVRHLFGERLVRMWPFAHDAGTGDSAANTQATGSLNELFGRPDVWRENFNWTSHWIPQFTWMAMWLWAGTP
jgi:hypothetical protein